MRAQYNNSLGVFYGNEDTVEQDILQAFVENKLTSPTAQTDTGLAYNQIMEERSRFIMSVTVLYTLYTKSAGAINLASVCHSDIM